MNNRKLILVRGWPGSGKTTFADKLIIENLRTSNGRCPIVAVSADDFMRDEDGNYAFSRDKLQDAHKACQDQVREFLTDGVHAPVVVHNTFIKLWEMEPYLKMADELNIPVEIYKCSGNYKNVHGVPDAKVQQMKNNYEPYEGDIHVEDNLVY